MKLLQQYDGSHEEFDCFVMPVVIEKKSWQIPLTPSGRYNSPVLEQSNHPETRES
ncbi:hypothetical protein IMCC9480_1685 [Oxalobacteraceae bacterium IMCC9480]|nr:hypothetical protein IMCC9480_1685 [Oxalobacteraceae bacterium IMCC9480]